MYTFIVLKFSYCFCLKSQVRVEIFQMQLTGFVKTVMDVWLNLFVNIMCNYIMHRVLIMLISIRIFSTMFNTNKIIETVFFV